MITSLQKFRESFEAPKNFKINMIPKTQMKRVISPYGNRTGEDDRPGVEVFGRMPQNIPQLPGFTRLLYKENNPQHIPEIDFTALDIIYELKLNGELIYSEAHKKETKASALYYGWVNDNDYLDSHFFVILCTKKINGKSDYSFTSDPVTLTKEEMIDTVKKLQHEIMLYKIDEIQIINPSTINNGILDDSADYFH